MTDINLYCTEHLSCEEIVESNPSIIYDYSFTQSCIDIKAPHWFNKGDINLYYFSLTTSYDCQRYCSDCWFKVFQSFEYPIQLNVDTVFDWGVFLNLLKSKTYWCNSCHSPLFDVRW